MIILKRSCKFSTMTCPSYISQAVLFCTGMINVRDSASPCNFSSYAESSDPHNNMSVRQKFYYRHSNRHKLFVCCCHMKCLNSTIYYKPRFRKLPLCFWIEKFTLNATNKSSVLRNTNLFGFFPHVRLGSEMKLKNHWTKQQQHNRSVPGS